MNSDGGFFDIDPAKLDVFWCEQAKGMKLCGDEAADARRDYEQSKTVLDIVRAELDRDIRKSPSDFGLDKITETAVSNTIILQSRWQKANQDVIDKRHEMDVRLSTVTAWDHRKKALEALTQLYQMQWFAEPRVPKDSEQRAISDIKSERAFGGKKRKVTA